MFFQGLPIEFSPAALGAEDEVILALSWKRLLKLLLFDRFFLVCYYFLLLFLFYLWRLLYLLWFFSPGWLLLLGFLFGRLFGD